MQSTQPVKASSWKKYFVILSLLATLFISAFFIAILSGPGTVFDYAFKVGTALAGYPFKTDDDRVNILLLGNAGGKHDGAYLTDTIIVASYNLKTQKATFISLPRDLWLEKTNSKVNAIYEKGLEDDTGLDLSKETITHLLGIPIHYGVRIDFSGFERAVDEVEGIEVEVAKTFDDHLYPITGKEEDMCGYKEEEKEFNEEEAKALNIEKGKRKVLIAPDGKIATDSAEPNKGYEYFSCRYEHIHFDKGPTQMDGSTSLKFVRSRMGSNGEGSDFARSARQQKVIEAFRKKVLSIETLINPKKITGLISAFGQSFETDIPVDDMVSLYGVTKKLSSSTNIVLSNNGPDALLFNPPPSEFGGAWVLIPKDRSYKTLQEFIKTNLEGEGINESTSSARTR
jgi:polyisoprenyl-teichoic acid--peptidoglycan teichoic acid transferase